MSVNVRLIKKETMITSKWTGGTTTQIAIDPPDAEYAKRCFKWRVSTATVELEESEFTALPGFDRILMVLEGELEIVHQDHYRKKLSAYEIDTFKGEWTTKSYGKVKDFNLMMREGSFGELFARKIQFGSKNEMILKNTACQNYEITHFIYSPNIDIEIESDEKIYKIKMGEMLCFDEVSADILINLTNNQMKAEMVVIGWVGSLKGKK